MENIGKDYNKEYGNYKYNDMFQRQILLLGEENQEKIRNTKIAIFGLRRSRLICIRIFYKKWCRKYDSL